MFVVTAVGAELALPLFLNLRRHFIRRRARARRRALFLARIVSGVSVDVGGGVSLTFIVAGVGL